MCLVDGSVSRICLGIALGTKGVWDYHLQASDDKTCTTLCGLPCVHIREPVVSWGDDFGPNINFSYCKTCEDIATRKIT